MKPPRSLAFAKPNTFYMKTRRFTTVEKKDGPLVNVSFLDKEGKLLKKVAEPTGMSILEVAKKNDIDLEGTFLMFRY